MTTGASVALASLPVRSAVVTRRSEPTIVRVLVIFSKFSASDAALHLYFLPDVIEPFCIQSGACAIT